MTIEIRASAVKCNSTPVDMTAQIFENQDQAIALANLLAEFVRNRGVLTKKQVYAYSNRGWCSRPSFYRMLGKMRESGMIFVSATHSYYLRTEFGEALVRLGWSWMNFVKSIMRRKATL